MESFMIATLFVLAATQASASMIGDLAGTYYGACTTPVAVSANQPMNKCIPQGNLVNQAYNVTFRADEMWNWTIATNQIKVGGKNYKAEGYSVPMAPLKMVKAMDTGFCVDTGSAYVTMTHTVVKMTTGGTIVLYEEVGNVDYMTNEQTYKGGCPSASHAVVCDPKHNYYQYRCSAVMMMPMA